jgi:S1-C subfamily serine protease
MQRLHVRQEPSSTRTGPGGWRFASPLPLIILAAALIGGLAGAAVASLWTNESTTTIVQEVPAGSTVPGVADLYASVRQSVVKITSVSTSTGIGGTGSGIVLDKDGHIATNYHVVDGFDQLDVKLADGTAVPAQVVGSDPGDDLAIIKVDLPSDQLTPAMLGDFSEVRVGDAVIAIGNPFDLEATLTEGVISGMGRTLSGVNARPLRQLIQTDTAINPGNSGGGLFNLNGELVGITNAIENPSGQDVFVGIGYAIPVSTLQNYLDEMLAGETISHARLGVSLQDLTPAIASSLGLSVEQGVLIGAVDPNSGAASAGLRGMSADQVGDVITAIDGQEVTSFEELAAYLDTKNPGDSVELTVIRDQQEMTVAVTLDAWTS